MLGIFIKLQTEIRKLERKNHDLEVELEKLTRELDRVRKENQSLRQQINGGT